MVEALSGLTETEEQIRRLETELTRFAERLREEVAHSNE